MPPATKRRFSSLSSRPVTEMSAIWVRVLLALLVFIGLSFVLFCFLFLQGFALSTWRAEPDAGNTQVVTRLAKIFEGKLRGSGGDPAANEKQSARSPQGLNGHGS